MTKVLIVEDEPGLVTLLKYNLEKQGYETVVAMDGKVVMQTVETEHPELILMDWMLPNMSGIDLCREIRQTHDIKHIPIIMLTARGEEADKVRGLSYGADDYMTKPFSVPELIARIQALLRRVVFKPLPKALEVGRLVMDFDKKQVYKEGQPIDMGPTEFRLLQVLMEHPEKVISRAELLKLVWGDMVHVEERTVDVHIKRLRKCLQEQEGDEIIRTVRSGGYALKG
ncbi:MAG: phosphate regulon transcriptional regulator PhoB [Alphaproteobacteria bacterium]|nr:phosphate regulon transcriptional regulator PhoB [Alphaproteobacteria bacterium]